MTTPLSIIILAAGKGTRMKSDKAKVLHPVFDKPMVQHVLAATEPLSSPNRIAIIGHQRQAVMDALAEEECSFAVQEEQLGTAHAVLIAQDAVADECEDVMILCGDTPLISSDVLVQMYSQHRDKGASLSLMTTILDNPTNYGRIICDANGNAVKITEQKDATEEERQIREINAGIYCVNKEFLYSALSQVDSNNSQGEFYLTDILELAIKNGKVVAKFCTDAPKDVLGVNSRIELAEAEAELRLRRNKRLMLEGITMVAPDATYVSEASIVGKDSLIGRGVELRGNCVIGDNCTLDSGAILENCSLASNSHIGPYSYLNNIHKPESVILGAQSILKS